MCAKQKRNFCSKNRPVFHGRGPSYDVGHDAKAIWSDVVYDVLQKDRSDAGLTAAIDDVLRLDTVAFLRALDATQDILVEDYFHWSFTFEDFGLEDAYGLPGRMILRDVPDALVRLVEYVACWAGSNPLMYLKSVYQIVAFPLRIDVGECAFDYGDVISVNDSRDKFVPSKLCKRIARHLFTKDFVNNVVEGFKPKHGPGSVAFRRGNRIATKRLEVADKDQVMDLRLFEQLCRDAGIPCYDIPEGLAAETSTLPVPSVMMDVPKTWKKRRLIAIEDVTRMYFAKGVQAGLYYAIQKHPILKAIIDLTDSSLNAAAAQFGSLTATYATVDLSAASDCVGERFVRELLGEDHPLWRILRQARPNQLDVPGYGVVNNHIFATMGNAVCFPILTLVVTIILLEAHVLSKVRRSSPRVYGDDAVCPEQAVKHFTQLLERYGFSVNIRKTYTGRDPYRESCGGEYLRGIDITPLRLSRKFRGLRLGRGFEHFMDLCALANDCYRYGFFRAYRRVTRVLAGFGYVPFTHEGSIGLRHANPSACMSLYPHLSVRGTADEWVVVQMQLGTHVPRRTRGYVGYQEWLWHYGRECHEEPYEPPREGWREEQSVAAGARPAGYRRARCAFNATYAYLANWAVHDGQTVVHAIDPELIREDEEARWRQL